MTKTIHFNTRRCYTANGQRITATLHDDGVVTFYDHDRHIDGEFLHAVPEWPFDTSAVMDAYDTNTAKSTRRSWEDGMMSTGCNARFQTAEEAEEEARRDAEKADQLYAVTEAIKVFEAQIARDERVIDLALGCDEIILAWDHGLAVCLDPYGTPYVGSIIGAAAVNIGTQHARLLKLHVTNGKGERPKQISRIDALQADIGRLRSHITSLKAKVS